MIPSTGGEHPPDPIPSSLPSSDPSESLGRRIATRSSGTNKFHDLNETSGNNSSPTVSFPTSKGVQKHSKPERNRQPLTNLSISDFVQASTHINLQELAKKFEELVEPSPDTEEKLRRLFEIPEKERASCSEVAVTEASFSSEFTASMSSVPPPSGKFSLNEIKAKIMKKKESEKPEKPDEVVISNPLPIVATRPKGSAKKRKTPDSTTGLDSFEGLSVTEVKEKINSTLNSGYERILELMKEQEVELRNLRETCANLRGMLADRQKLEESHAQEIERLLARADEEKKKIVEEAQESAVNSVYQAMSEMAKEATDHGFTLPHWDYQGLGESVKLKAKVAESQETQVAPVDEGKGGGAGGECSKVTMGDDSENAKA